MTITTRNGGRRVGLTALLTLPAILFALTACAPASGGGAGSANEGSDRVTSGESALTQWKLDYAACMRAEGIDMPDPESDGQGKAAKGLGPGADQDAAAAAGEKCVAELGEMPPPSAEDRAAADQAMLEWATEAAECYRENGYDMPDPKAGEEIQFPTNAPQEVVQECGGVAPGQVQE